MAQLSLNKSIEARKMNSKTGASLPGLEVTVPFGALVDKIERDRRMARFWYLGELYQCPYDLLVSALDAGALDAGAPPPPAELPVEPSPSVPAGPRVEWERLNSSGSALLRAKVPGGWLVIAGSGLAFYPDAGHEWDGGSLPAAPAGEAG